MAPTNTTADAAGVRAQPGRGAAGAGQPTERTLALLLVGVLVLLTIIRRGFSGALGD